MQEGQVYLKIHLNKTMVTIRNTELEPIPDTMPPMTN